MWQAPGAKCPMPVEGELTLAFYCAAALSVRSSQGHMNWLSVCLCVQVCALVCWHGRVDTPFGWFTISWQHSYASLACHAINMLNRSPLQPTHKMQSGDGAPTISLQLVPKMLAPLASLWVPHAFVVSFKLETDENLLIVKARDSLNKYKHKVSVVNHTR